MKTTGKNFDVIYNLLMTSSDEVILDIIECNNIYIIIGDSNKLNSKDYIRNKDWKNDEPFVERLSTGIYIFFKSQKNTFLVIQIESKFPDLVAGKIYELLKKNEI